MNNSWPNSACPACPPEGRFFPDTYTYGKGTSELHVMERAAKAMTKQLAAAWGKKAAFSTNHCTAAPAAKATSK